MGISFYNTTKIQNNCNERAVDTTIIIISTRLHTVMKNRKTMKLPFYLHSLQFGGKACKLFQFDPFVALEFDSYLTLEVYLLIIMYLYIN